MCRVSYGEKFSPARNKGLRGLDAAASTSASSDDKVWKCRDVERTVDVIVYDVQRLLLTCHATATLHSTDHQTQTRTNSDHIIITEGTKTLIVQAFISCRLDYCNSLLYGVTDKLMRHVQSVQNAAARLITGAKRREHITPT